MKTIFTFFTLLVCSYNTMAQSVIEGVNPATESNAYAIKGTISSTNPGCFSAAVRGQNNGTGGLGIGVYGSQNGSGWGIYGTSPTGIGVHGNSENGYAIFGQSSTGTAFYGTSTNGPIAYFTNTTAGNTNTVLTAITSGGGKTAVFSNTYSSNSNTVLTASTSGTGSVGSFSITNVANDNTTLTASTNGTGRTATFTNTNNSNNINTVGITSSGIGSGLNINLTNASNGGRGIDVSQAGVGPGVFSSSSGGNAVWGITNAISAAGVIGDNNAGGEAVVGRVTSSDPAKDGSGVGSVVGRNDLLNGYGVRGFVTKAGAIGVYGQGGVSGGINMAAKFENVNASNTTDVVQINSAATSNLLVLKKSGANVARINSVGTGYFNGGTVNSGADIAEAFKVEGKRQEYEPGDVMIISTDNDRTLTRSTNAYSNLVVGVYATKPGVLLTEENTDNLSDDNIPLGVVGVIPTKVCLEGGVIKRGDFLVTSSQPGVAMKADQDKIKVGQLIGKALQDYSSNTVGKIKVLVNVR